MACELEEKKNLGLSRCNELPGLLVTGFLTPDDFEIPAATLEDQDLLETFLQNAMLDPLEDRVYLLPDFSSFENISKEVAYQDTPHAYRKVANGKYRFRFGISESMCMHRALYTHGANNGRFIPVDDNNKIMVTKKSNGNFAGYRIQMLNPEMFKFNDGSNATESPIVVALRNSLEIDKNGYMASADFIGDLARISDVTIEIISSIATKVKVKVYTTCDKIPVTGLALADFLMLTAAGAAQTISSITEVNGTYDLNGTGLVTGTVELDPPDVLTIKAYETPEPAEFTI